MADPSDPVDAYFARLDAALTARAASIREAAPAPAQASATPVPPPAEPSLVAEAFAAFLALEEGDASARPVRLVTGSGADLRISDALIEELARRVAERLKNDV
jgi:hypothetical protein